MFYFHFPPLKGKEFYGRGNLFLLAAFGAGFAAFFSPGVSSCRLLLVEMPRNLQNFRQHLMEVSQKFGEILPELRYLDDHLQTSQNVSKKIESSWN